MSFELFMTLLQMHPPHRNLTVLECVYSTPIDNGFLNETPEIVCGSNSIGFNIETRNRFEGHVYVKASDNITLLALNSTF